MTKNNLEEILAGYLACALWTEEGQLESLGEINFLQGLVSMFSEASKEEAKKDIISFINQIGEAATQEMAYTNGLSQIGHDLWLTRNGHGSGFWERGYENQNIIMLGAKKLGEKSLYFDGWLQFE